MPGVFSLPSFLRRAPNELLRNFFAAYPAFAGFDWTSVSERHVELVLERFQELPAAERGRVSSLFQRVEALANSEGSQVLIQVARDCNVEIAEQLSALGNSLARALWTCMNHPRVFENARTLAHVDGLPKRSWETRKVLAVPNLEATPEMKGALSQRIAAFFQELQQRGEHCKVDHASRDGEVEYFFAYPADYVDELLGYDEEGKFEQKSYQAAFEVVFGYHPADGTLDIYAAGGRSVRDHLAQAFCSAVLGTDEAPEQYPTPSFDLEQLKNRNFTFPTNPRDQIRLVRIKPIRLQFHTGSAGKLTFEMDGRRREGSVHDVIGDRLSQQHAQLAGATVLSVVPQAFFHAPTARDRSVTFRLSAPSFCDLEDSPEEQILRHYLREWGIEQDANAVEDAALAASVQ